MTTQQELRTLIDQARERGAILRTRVDGDTILEVSIGMLPPGPYRKLGAPGSGWMPLIAAAERLREFLAA